MIKRLKIFLLKPYSKNKVNVFISLLIVHQGKLLLLKSNNQYNMISSKINFEKKKNIAENVKSILANKVFKDISIIKNIKLLDCCRVVSTCKKCKIIKDDLFFKIELKDLTDDNLLENLEILNLESLKLECFKNKFNIYDYRLFLKAILTN